MAAYLCLMHPAAQSATPAPQFFDGFVERYVETPDGPIFCRVAGSGPPLVLLHGSPQTSAMWHAVAPVLAQTYQVICPDLRGYGRSLKPATDATHAPYAKRAMAGDVLALMDHLGHDRFLIGAHDRGCVIGKVQGAGTTVETQVYDYIDLSPRTGVNYYRLKQVDFNGAFDYSPTIAIDLAKEKITAEVFPSPASEVLNVRVNKAIATIQIYDITGRTVASYILDGATTTQLDVAKLRSGTYFVSIQSENTREVVRFIKN